jgi:hypothetical protein
VKDLDTWSEGRPVLRREPNDSIAFGSVCWQRHDNHPIAWFQHVCPLCTLLVEDMRVAWRIRSGSGHRFCHGGDRGSMGGRSTRTEHVLVLH